MVTYAVFVVAVIVLLFTARMWAESLLPLQEAILGFLIPSAILVSPYREGLLILFYVVTQAAVCGLVISPLLIPWRRMHRIEERAAKERARKSIQFESA